MTLNQIEDDTKLALDAASIAAEGIGKSTGLQNPDAAAQAIISLENRMTQVENVIPVLQEAYDAAAIALKDLQATQLGGEVFAKLKQFVDFGENKLGFRHDATKE